MLKYINVRCIIPDFKGEFMNLEDICEKKVVLNLSALAQKIGYSRSHLSLVFSKKLRMSTKLAIAIENLSQGKIKATDLLNEYGRK